MNDGDNPVMSKSVKKRHEIQKKTNINIPDWCRMPIKDYTLKMNMCFGGISLKGKLNNKIYCGQCKYNQENRPEQ